MHAEPPPPAPGTSYPPFQNPQGYRPPYYQQPYAGPMPPPPSVVGDEGVVIAGLCYLLFLIGLIMFFVEERNRFVKFHAAQSLIIHLAAIVATTLWVVLFIVGLVAGAILGAATNNSGGASAAFVGLFVLIAVAIGVVLAILYVAALIWGMVAAFSGRVTKLPLFGGLAERLSGGAVAQP